MNRIKGYKTYGFTALIALLLLFTGWGWIDFNPVLFDSLMTAFGLGAAWGVRDALN